MNYIKLIILIDCKIDNELKPKDPIKCKVCQYKVLYKKRTTMRNILIYIFY